jgi:opacity protein-like surface antigen
MKLINRLRLMVIILITFTTLSSILYGQNSGSEEHNFYIGPQLGVFNAIDADEASFMGGVAARLKFGEILGIEASINYRQEKYLGNSVTVKNWPVMVTGLVYPLSFVYGGIGAGWYNSNYTYNNSLLETNYTSDTQQKFGWHFGGGVEIPVGKIGKIVGDLRYVFLDYDFNEFPGSNNVNADYYVFMVGILFGL